MNKTIVKNGNDFVVLDKHEDIKVDEIMKTAVEYYKYIDVMGEMLSKIIKSQIEPLLNDKKYKEAKIAVDKFYDSSRYEGEIIFIERDMLMATINRLAHNEISK